MGRVKGLAWSLVVAPLSVLSFPIYPLLLRMEATPLNPGAWSRLRAICGLSPLLHSPGEGGAQDTPSSRAVAGEQDAASSTMRPLPNPEGIS